MQRVCVYCGSNSGFDPAFVSAAAAVGKMLAENGMGLIYGGGSVGLMGAAADAALLAGGEVTGIIPRKLITMEVEHRGLTKLIEVDTMHERKWLMMENSDAFLVLPGGYGTLEELFEVITWLQLGFHNKPVCLFNVNGYYDALLTFLETMETSGLISQIHRGLLRVATNVEDVLPLLKVELPEHVGKWKVS